MSVIYFIRHGQASFFSKNYDELSALGKLQSESLGLAFNDRKVAFHLVHCGTMQRHRKTAECCLDIGHKVPQPAIYHSPIWNEYDHLELIKAHRPDLQRQEDLHNFVKSQPEPLKAIHQLLSHAINDWIANKHEYLQSWVTFKQHILKEVYQIANQLPAKKNVVVFTSGGPIAVITMALFQLQDNHFTALQSRLVNTGITKVLVGKSGLTLSTFNDYSHLEHHRELITYR